MYPRSNPQKAAALAALAAGAGLLLFAFAHSRAQNTGPAGPTAERTRLDAQRTMGAPKTFRNLTLVPVYDATARPSDRFMTLDEGLKAKVVSVKEKVAQGGEVNTLLVTNRGKKPLYLMAGEVVLGGQQDRLMGQDTIVPPDKKDQPVTVFCVEHGRWAGKAEFEKSAKTVASADIRGAAQDGAFPTRAGVAAPTGGNVAAQTAPNVAGERPAQQAQTLSGRQSANVRSQRQVEGSGTVLSNGERVSRAQSEVWDKVAAKNRRFKADNSTGTYGQVLEVQAHEAQKDLAPYLKAFSAGLGNDPSLVGVVVAINGKVVSADIFNNPTLFKKLWPKLLHSYAADAAENGPVKGKKTPVVTGKEAKEFLVEAMDAKSKVENKSAVSTTLRLESTVTKSYQLLDAKPASGAGGRAGFGGAVHSNVLRK